jgi:hypothetical protein
MKHENKCDWPHIAAGSCETLAAIVLSLTSGMRKVVNKKEYTS